MADDKTQQINLDDIVKTIDRASETFAYEIWVPSLKRNVMFKEINTSQQKRLIKSIIDSPIYNTEFIFTLYKLIEENCVEKLDTGNLTILDKLFIAIAMRSTSINDVLELEFKIDEKTVKRGISLMDIIKKCKDTINIQDTITLTDDKQIFTLECSIPTIRTEYGLEQESRKGKSPNMNANTPEELRETIGNAFIDEIIKYINVLSIKNGDDIVKITFNDINFANRMSLTERLPIKLIEKLVKYIASIKVELDKVVLIKIEHEGKVMEQRLTIDGSFFMSS